MFKVLDSIFTDLLDAADSEFAKDLLCTLLLLFLQTLKSFVDLAHMGCFCLVLGELGLLVFLLLQFLVSPVLELSFAIAVKVLLGISHGLFDLLDSPHFLIDLTFNFLEDSDSFHVGGASVLHFLEDMSESVAKVDQILMDLSDLVE